MGWPDAYDAFLLSALLSIIVREGLHDQVFLAKHCVGFEKIEPILRELPVEDYVRRADVPLEDVKRVARGLATAVSACVRVDLGIQHSPHSTLNSYFEKLLFLITGNFGIKGGNNLHDFLVPILENTDERSLRFKRSVYHHMFPVSGFLPPNILPDEILRAGDRRIRSVLVDSSNPLVTWPNTQAFERAFNSLELLIVVDVAMTETARLAHYVLPAASQFEKWEFSGFNLDFPVNAFHLRHPLFAPLDEALPEPEIYTRLLEAMGEIPRHFPLLSTIAKWEPKKAGHLGFMSALAAKIVTQKSTLRYAPSIIYRSLGHALPPDAAATAVLLPLTIMFAGKHWRAVRRAGFKGSRLTLGSHLFRAILANRAGVVFSKREYSETWSLMGYKDQRIRLAVPEMLKEWLALKDETPPSTDYPFILCAGERRSYNANQLFRDPAWRKVDPHGAMRMHPSDAARLGVDDGNWVVCENQFGSIEAVVEIEDSMRPGVVSLPHGYGMRYREGNPIGPVLNRLTSNTHCDPLMRTPYHKYVPVRLLRRTTL